MSYDLQPMKAPRAAGTLLRLLTALLENPLVGPFLAAKLLKDAGMGRLHEVPADDPEPMTHPLFAEPKVPQPGRTAPDLAALPAVNAFTGGFAFETVGDFHVAYRDGKLTPETVADRLLAATEATERHSPPLRLFIAQKADDVRAQAAASAARWRQGRPLGPLDGIPVAVKDEVDALPYPTTAGTAFLGREAATSDGTVVARLRASGAMIAGKANMQEIGLGVIAINPHHGPARNPYDPARSSGGSSSGSAAAVAAGLCPIAVGADGGGSIRIPAAFCGQVGLKATFGRMSEHGASPLCWSVAHVGPIAACVRDTALAYAVMGGADPLDANTAHQPPLHLEGFGRKDLKGVRLGIFRPWFEDAEPDVVLTCYRVIEGLVAAGASLVDVTIPELGLMSIVHTVSIVGEMAAAHAQHYAAHRREYGYDVRFNLGLARRLRAHDYVQAQRHRVRLQRHYMEALRQVDAIVTPTTGCTTPRLAPDALATGEANLVLMDRIMRYARPANVTGLPALTVPAGYDSDGLPIGLQVMGRPWEEPTLLQIGLIAEGIVSRRSPRVHHRLLTSP